MIYDFLFFLETQKISIYISMWPVGQRPEFKHGTFFLKARAVENLAYVVGVNRVGEDENKLIYPGHSQVIDPLGNYLIEPFEEEKCKVIEIDKNNVVEIRSKLPF